MSFASGPEGDLSVDRRLKNLQSDKNLGGYP
jgi:hypothetical protein